MNEEDIVEEGSIALAPAQETTEASVEHIDDVALPEDFPVRFKVSTRIADRNNPNSLVYFDVQLVGPNNEDLGQETLIKDIQGIDQPLDDVAQALGAQAAQTFYRSDQYAKFVKIAPKMAEQTETQPALSLDPVLLSLSTLSENVTQLSQVLAQLQADQTQQRSIDQLQRDLTTLTEMVADIQKGQRIIADWLTAVYRALTS